MPATKAEIAYLEHRLGATLLQCESASGECSKASHEGLVELYRLRLAALGKIVRRRGWPTRCSNRRERLR
jgi:hypothetical protein